MTTHNLQLSLIFNISSHICITDSSVIHAIIILLLLSHPYIAHHGFDWHHHSKNYRGAYLLSIIIGRWPPDSDNEAQKDSAF